MITNRIGRHESKKRNHQWTRRNARQQRTHLTRSVHSHERDMLTVPLTVLLHCPVQAWRVNYPISAQIAFDNFVIVLIKCFITSVECNAGTFYNKDTHTCQNCAEGSFQNRTGQFSCEPCPAGRWSFGGHSKSFIECFGTWMILWSDQVFLNITNIQYCFAILLSSSDSKKRQKFMVISTKKRKTPHSLIDSSNDNMRVGNSLW